MAIDIARTDNADLITLSIKGVLDESTASQAQASLDEMFGDQIKHVTLDLDGLELIDEAGVQVVVKLAKRLRAMGGEFDMVGVNGQPAAIFKLLRMDKVIHYTSHA